MKVNELQLDYIVVLWIRLRFTARLHNIPASNELRNVKKTEGKDRLGNKDLPDDSGVFVQSWVATLIDCFVHHTPFCFSLFCSIAKTREND